MVRITEFKVSKSFRNIVTCGKTLVFPNVSHKMKETNWSKSAFNKKIIVTNSKVQLPKFVTLGIHKDDLDNAIGYSKNEGDVLWGSVSTTNQLLQLR